MKRKFIILVLSLLLLLSILSFASCKKNDKEEESVTQITLAGSFSNRGNIETGVYRSGNELLEYIYTYVNYQFFTDGKLICKFIGIDVAHGTTVNQTEIWDFICLKDNNDYNIFYDLKDGKITEKSGVLKYYGDSIGIKNGKLYLDGANSANEFTGIVKLLSYTAQEGGYITGDTKQFVLNGKNGTSVTAVAKAEYVFDCWSDGVKTATRQDLNVQDDITVYAKFKQNSAVFIDICSTHSSLNAGEVCSECNKECYIKSGKNILMKDLSDNLFSIEFYEEEVEGCFNSYLYKTKEIIVSNNVISICGFWNSYYSNCDKITLKYEKNSQLTTIDNSFIGTPIEHLFLPKTIKNITYSFNDISILTEVNIGEKANGVYNSFKNTKWWEAQNDIVYINDICLGVKNSLPLDSKITIKNGTKTISKEAFKGFTGLREIILPNSVEIIEEDAFANCSSLIKITLSNNLQSLPNNLFANCESLNGNEYENCIYLATNDNPYFLLFKAKNLDITEAKIHNDCKLIYYGAFSGCSNLTSITIPNSVTSIEYRAFYNCTNLKTVYYKGTQAEWEKITIASVNSYLTNANIIYV